VRQLALITLILAFIAGCQPSSGTVPVKGKVTLKGAPVADGTLVTFWPIGTGETASGRVQSGEYELFSGNRGDVGAKPGKYKVVLTSGTSMQQSDYSKTTSSTQAKAPTAGGGEIPKQYTAAETTTLEKEVTSGSNTIAIEVP